MPLDKNALVVSRFKGLGLNRTATTLEDSYDSEMPFDYAISCVNMEFKKRGGIRTRASFEMYITNLVVPVARPIQMWQIHNLNGVPQTDRWLILTWDNTTGRLYDSGVVGPATNPILTITGMKYAFILNAFGRIYITPWSAWATPLASEFVYMYNGLTNARLAGGVNPTVGAFAVAVAAGGNCTPGLHYATVLYEYDTGYISFQTAAHALTPLSATTTSANATMNFTNVPLGAAGTGVVKRHIIITKVVVNPNGKGLLGYEPFFAVTINDNTTTTATFNEPDSALVESAQDHIGEGEKFPNIPSVVSMVEFGSRMVYLGIRDINVTPPGTNTKLDFCIYVSPPNNPEQILAYIPSSAGLAGLPPNESPNLIPVGPMYPGQVMIGAELNKILYAFKENSTFSITADDESDPSEWVTPACVDGSKGAFPFGIAKAGFNPGSLVDGRLIVAGNHGITSFNGTYSQDNLGDNFLPLYTYDSIKWAKLVVDTTRKLLVVRLGDPAVGIEIQVGNYYYGMSSDSIRWSTYSFNGFPVGHAVGGIGFADLDLRKSGTAGNTGYGATNFTTSYPLITLLVPRFIGGANYAIEIISETKLYDCQDFFLTNDPLISILWGYTTGFTPNNQGEVYTFGPLKIRMYGAAFIVGKTDLRNIPTVIAPSITEGEAGGKYLSFNVNEVGEQIRISISGGEFGGSSNSFANISKLILHAFVQAVERPRV